MSSIIPKACKQNNVTFEEATLLQCYFNKVPIKDTNKILLDKGLIRISTNLFNKYEITAKGYELMKNIHIDSAKLPTNIKETELIEIAEAIRDIYPKGKKPGTNYLWRDSVALLAKRLKLLITKLDVTFTKEQAIKATENYVNSFKGDYRYMELLKYFILKNNTYTGEVKSNFMSYIENEDSVEEITNDWTDNLK